MFDNAEIKKLRQDIDALSAQIDMMNETMETRHKEMLARLDSFEQILREDREQQAQKIEDAQYEDDSAVYDRAEELVREIGKASTSYLQRTLGIGYSRAARLIDMLEENGVIGPGDGAKPREVIDQREE